MSLEILIRGPPPEYCQVSVKGVGHAPDGKKVKTAFYKLARPTTPDNLLFVTSLSPAERAQAIQIIVNTGEVGSPIDSTDHRFIMMQPAAVGFGQRYPRVSQQLLVKIKYGCNYQYPPLCTIEDCFSTTCTETSEMNPKCISHKGNELGFAVLEYGTHNAAGDLTKVGHFMMSCHYDPPLKDHHFELAFRRVGSDRKPPGERLRVLFFDSEDDARKTFCIWQCTRLLQSLRVPSLTYTTKQISFANGFEQEMKNEFSSIRLKLEGNPSTPGIIPLFPFGRRFSPNDQPQDFVTDQDGLLYVYSDENTMYGRQQQGKEPWRGITGGDGLSQYLLRFVTFTPISTVPKDDLLKAEAHLHVCLYLAYLLGLKNPFVQKYANTRPYLLNLLTFTSHFDNCSWALIQDLMKCLFSVDVNLIPY